MKVELQKKEIEKVLSVLSLIAPKKSPLPITDNYHISVNKNEMTISVNTLEEEGKATLPCESQEKFNFLVDIVKFSKVVQLSEDKIKMTYTGKNHVLEIVSGKAKYKYSVQEHEDFPVWEKIEKYQEVTIPKITEIFKRSIPAVNKDELRRNMSGIYVGEKEIVATDGFRLIVNPIESTCKTPIIIPLKFCTFIAKLTSDNIVLRISENDLELIYDSYRFRTKLIDDTFPTYKTVIPHDDTLVRKMTVKVQDLIKSLMIAKTSGDSFTDVVKMEYVDETTLKISASSAEAGSEAETLIECKTEIEDPTKYPVKCGFKNQYWMECLNFITDETVTIQTTSSDSKAAIVKTNEFTYLIMPRRVA